MYLQQWRRYFAMQVCNCINTLRPMIFKLISMIDGWGISGDNVLRWMLLDLTNGNSTSVQVMAWCHQARSHYLSQCWPRPMTPYGVTRLQWVNTLRLHQNDSHIGDNISICIFSQWKIPYFDQKVHNDSRNGFVLNRQRAITWTNDDPVHWTISASPGIKGLIFTPSSLPAFILDIQEVHVQVYIYNVYLHKVLLTSSHAQ